MRLLLAPAQMLCGSQAAAKLIPQLILLGLTEVKWDSDRLQCDLQHRSRLCGTSSLVHLFDHQHCGWSPLSASPQLTNSKHSTTDIRCENLLAAIKDVVRKLKNGPDLIIKNRKMDPILIKNWKRSCSYNWKLKREADLISGSGSRHRARSWTRYRCTPVGRPRPSYYFFSGRPILIINSQANFSFLLRIYCVMRYQALWW